MEKAIDTNTSAKITDYTRSETRLTKRREDEARRGRITHRWADSPMDKVIEDTDDDGVTVSILTVTIVM